MVGPTNCKEDHATTLIKENDGLAVRKYFKLTLKTPRTFSTFQDLVDSIASLEFANEMH